MTEGEKVLSAREVSVSEFVLACIARGVTIERVKEELEEHPWVDSVVISGKSLCWRLEPRNGQYFERVWSS